MEFKTRTIINAPARDIFGVLTEPKNYAMFDPNCIKIEGDIKKGNSIKINSKICFKLSTKVRVSELKPDERMVWESGLPFGLFKSVRTFTVIAKDDNTSEFQMNEVFSGPLLGLLANMIPDMSHAFKLFSQGLKRFMESRP